MRYENGLIKIFFSKAIRVKDSSVAETKATREAFFLFAASKWSHSHKLIVESDSRNVAKWTSKPSDASWRIRKWVLHIERLKKEIKRWEIKHVNLIPFMVRTPTFSIIWNGTRTNTFSRTRGIRQGDPLSPYLFVLCLEKLSQLIDNKVWLGNWRPLLLTRNGPFLAHVCYADDLVLFRVTSTKQVQVMMKTLDRFYLVSGQKVGLSKWRLLVSSKVSPVKAKNLSSIAKTTLTKDFGKYHGAPATHERITQTTYSELINEVQLRMESWSNKYLSVAGRISLVQSVTSTTATYPMQTTFLLKTLSRRSIV
ncbi:Uncharacterized protein TCM_013937 [Theobroma cacao]|uniref:Reverse transcriptase domain-containing protein n=1 Tax=Theobroma cacao TaxID=3641 RepID=A0A061FXL8_THECC|nr:Uncharacterized protein TCM_013937 [Theobroma cacao]